MLTPGSQDLNFLVISHKGDTKKTVYILQKAGMEF